ncbi:MAG: carboxypeptidase-like regulatory domain-containing protein [Haliscomenobacter sp.]|nr:carboxypeptidase-like regulatory domain-containing protein [Haliscomenobacter sp.]MBK9489825.1 carboxypeptidase-like regulatory domain-containing protein [Haliscomenobacter sp.]
MFILVLGSITYSLAQNPEQTLRGQVIDAVAQKALPGATVLLEGSTLGTTTDDNGKFRFENLPVGRYRLRVSFVGYDTLVVPELLLESGRETVLNLPLSLAYTTLSELSITAAPLELSSLNLSVRSISNETTLRFPGVFFDPARTASAFPRSSEYQRPGQFPFGAGQYSQRQPVAVGRSRYPQSQSYAQCRLTKRLANLYWRRCKHAQYTNVGQFCFFDRRLCGGIRQCTWWSF